MVVFSLNASRYGKLSAQIAALLIQDLTAATGYRLSLEHRPLALVAIDEFSSLDADNILALLAKGREAGVSVLLSTQEMADLNRLAPGFRDQVLGNSGMLIAHRQSVPESAELIARMIGTTTVWQPTYQTERAPKLLGWGFKEVRTGLGSQRQVEEFRIHPNHIKSLRVGQNVLITTQPRLSAYIQHTIPWTPPRQTTDGN